MDYKKFKAKFQKAQVKEFPNQVNETPLVSIIVLAYQHAEFISKCLDGILNQKTNFPLEIIIGEDASTDGTLEIVKRYARNNPDKIRLFLHNPLNKIKVLKETTGNFNAAYCYFQSRGRYIAICEGDDYWNDDYKLQKQVDFLETNPGFILSFHSYQNKYYKPLPQDIKYLQPDNDIDRKDLILLKEHPLLLTTCFRNEMKQIPRELLEVLNLDTFLFSILGEFGKAHYQKELRPAISRKHTGGIWSSKLRIKQLALKLHTLKKLESYYKNRNKKAYIHFKEKRRFQAKMLIRKAIKQANRKALIFGIKNYLG
ncbi:glycosyltransferase family 2 protein [Salegentibacter sediminis]|uniref:glycosyltransferase family 2 protein n=1 Tax=Salegentibacter sediminis TaxID=1930251 RepID=UPI0009BFB038|nr:glycosyltransferase family 2 protein [Salegentibacter sediminis]